MNKINKVYYQRCARCVMDTDAIDITFDKQGICNFCFDFLERSKNILGQNSIVKEDRLDQLVQRIKNDGKNKSYDCIVGISGGVDSSWTLVEVKRLGLRPLAVHMDNGWNSELAQNNISNLLNTLKVDLYTHVINWEEYRNLMQAFFDADVIDIELLYDNACLAVNYQQAIKYGLKHILAGTNNATEGMKMPKKWNWFKYDKRNIKALAKRNGLKGFKTFPTIGTSEFVWNHFVKRIRWNSFLDYLNYNKFHALDELEKNYGYKRYVSKHYESIFTRFYQGYILPKKFGVDKRKIHLATLVVSQQISRDEALSMLEQTPYSSNVEIETDITYFLKKMRWSRKQLDEYLARPEILHSNYSTEKPIWDYLLAFYKYLPRFK